MYVIVAVDDNNGMMFNKRRQSKDSVLNQRILDITREHKLFMNSYTYKMFETLENESIVVSEDFLQQAEVSDYCFVENVALSEYSDQIEQLIIYRWNRSYPSDQKFDLDINDWNIKSTFEFKGSSHEKITEKIYSR